MQYLVNGIIEGMTLALLGTGFAVVFLPLRVFNVTLAGIYVIAAAVTWQCLTWGVSPAGSIGFALASAAVLSALCHLNYVILENGTHRNRARRRSVGFARTTRSDVLDGHLISSVAIYTVVMASVLMAWGTEVKHLRLGASPPVNIVGATVSSPQIIAFVVVVAALAIFYAVLYASGAGLRLRAMADNPKEFALAGYNAGPLSFISFVASGLLVAIASLTSAYDRGFTPYGGFTSILLAVAATIVGGRRSFLGPLIGGLLLGLVRAGIAWAFSSTWNDAASLGVLTLALYLRPEGLVGSRDRVDSI
jgi:branched-chain amino acid transport system permease protein